jgi:hypothetical protein
MCLLTCSDGTTQGHQLNMATLQTTLSRLIAIIQQVGLDQRPNGATLLTHASMILSITGLWGRLFNGRHGFTARSPNTANGEGRKQEEKAEDWTSNSPRSAGYAGILKQTPFRGAEDKRPHPSRGVFFYFGFFLAFGFSRQKPCAWRARD